MITKFYARIFIPLLLLSACELLLPSEEKPEYVEKGLGYEIKLIDKTGSMRKIYSTDAVKDAAVLLKSNTLGVEYNLVSDEEGVVKIDEAISDLYLISAVRKMRGDEMEVLIGQKVDFFKLVNFSKGTIELRADNPSGYTVEMDKIILDSPILISEIYACGPPGSGLYYHDKYVEFYNQSDSIVYMDGLLVAYVYSSSYLGLNYVDDPEYVHTKNIWKFPGTGSDFPLMPGEFIVCAEDGIDHTINADSSVDLSNVSFEFYKEDAPDLDNPSIPNMIMIYQSSGNDWLIGGERGALVIAQMDQDSLKWYDDQLLVPYDKILDGVEYLKDPSKLDEKILSPFVDAGGTGGIQFYTGKTMERIPIRGNAGFILKDDNNSSLDFKLYNKPSPEYHNEYP